MSLVDAAIAIALLGGTLVACFTLMGSGTSTNTDARNTAVAYLAAQQEIELIRNISYLPSGTSKGLINITVPPAKPESPFIKPNGDPDASRPGDSGYPGIITGLQDLPNGSGRLVITDDPVNGNLCKNVTVIVRWTDRNNEPRNVVLATTIAEGGVSS